jgi:hypothetical protein
MPTPSVEKNAFLSKRLQFGLTIAVAVLVLLFVAVFLAGPDKLFADDSYFYFQVAWNFARGMGSTFNNVMPTNGYHPLWMLICAAIFKVARTKQAGIFGIAIAIALFDLVTLWIVRRLVALVANDLWPLAFVLLVPFCFLSQLGTEGAVSGMFLALLMYLGYQVAKAPSFSRIVSFNFVAALAVLSRLDNIFIVAFVWLAGWMALGREDDQTFRRLHLASLPIYLVLWGSYITSNWIYFHSIQPISGLLKSHNNGDHSLGTNLPHTALMALSFILICMPIVAMRRRDLFFQTVEVPLTLGILCHATYIVLRMSSETRWTWYYTSWILLASVLLARAGSIVIENRRWLAGPVSLLCVLVMLIAWERKSYRFVYRGLDPRPPISFNDVVYRKAGIRRALAYDQPGALAFYSDVEIIPLDGLMGNLDFQHKLATDGLRKVIADEQIDGFIGPPLELSANNSMCSNIYLSSVRFHCIPEKGALRPTGVDVYARMPFAFSGTLALNKEQIVWAKKDFASVWRISTGHEN